MALELFPCPWLLYTIVPTLQARIFGSKSLHLQIYTQEDCWIIVVALFLVLAEPPLLLFLGGSVGKESAWQCGRAGFDP